MKKALLSLLVCLPMVVFASESSLIDKNNHIVSSSELEDFYQNREASSNYLISHPDKIIFFKAYFSFRGRINDNQYQAMKTMVKSEEQLEETFAWQNLYANLDKKFSNKNDYGAKINNNNSCIKEYSNKILSDYNHFVLKEKNNGHVLSIKHNPALIGDVSSYIQLSQYNINNLNLIYIPSTYALELFLTNQDRDLNEHDLANLIANSTTLATSAYSNNQENNRTNYIKGMYFSFEDVQNLRVASLKNLTTLLYYSNNKKELMPSIEAIYYRNKALCLY